VPEGSAAGAPAGARSKLVKATVIKEAAPHCPRNRECKPLASKKGDTVRGMLLAVTGRLRVGTRHGRCGGSGLAAEAVLEVRERSGRNLQAVWRADDLWGFLHRN